MILTVPKPCGVWNRTRCAVQRGAIQSDSFSQQPTTHNPQPQDTTTGSMPRRDAASVGDGATTMFRLWTNRFPPNYPLACPACLAVAAVAKVTLSSTMMGSKPHAAFCTSSRPVRSPARGVHRLGMADNQVAATPTLQHFKASGSSNGSGAIVTRLGVAGRF